MTLKTAQRLTIFVMIGVTLGVLAYDAWVAYTATTDATISWVLWTYAHKYPIIPFSFGFLMGHLFFTQVSAKDM